MAESYSYEELTAPESFSYEDLATKRKSPLQWAGEEAIGSAEAFGSMASGMVAQPIAGLVGATNLPFGGDRAADLTRRTQETLTYQPRTESGQAQLRTAAYPATKLSELAQKISDWSFERTGSPMVGAATNMSLQAIPYILGKGARPLVERGLAAKQSELAGAASRNASRDITLRNAQQEGYVSPSPTMTGRALSSIGGKEVLRQDMASHNQQVTNRLARQAAEIAPDQPITMKTLDDARTIMEQPYREAASLSPTAAGALDEWKTARADKQAWYNRYGVSKHPDDLKKAKQFESEEAFWDRMLDAEAVKAGRPDLVPRLKDARMRLAKNFTIQRALNTSTGDVNARTIGQIFAKQKGQGLTGEIATIGSFANGPGWEVTRDISRVGVPGGQHGSAVEAGMGAVIGAKKGIKGAILGAGIPLARIPARALAMAPYMQPKPSYRPGLSYSLADIATASPEALALTPTTARPADESGMGPWRKFRDLGQ